MGDEIEDTQGAVSLISLLVKFRGREWQRMIRAALMVLLLTSGWVSARQKVEFGSGAMLRGLDVVLGDYWYLVGNLTGDAFVCFAIRDKFLTREKPLLYIKW